MLSLEGIGEVTQGYLPFLEGIDPYYVGIVELSLSISVIVTAVIASYVWLRTKLRSLRRKRSERRSRKQRILDERAVDLALEEKRYELAIQKFRHKDLEYRSKYSKPFRDLGPTRRFADCASASIAALAPRRGLRSELVGFKARIALSGDSVITQMKGNLSQIELNIEEQPKRFNVNKSIAIDQIKSDILSLEETIKEIEAEVRSEESEARQEEVGAKEIVNRWEKRLGRSAYFNTFNAFFEENINKWLEGQSWSRTKGEDPEKEEKEADGALKDVGLLESVNIYIRSLLQSIFKGLTTSKDVLKYFTFSAFAPEFLYSYTAFNVLANGDVITTLSGTFVFTLGMLTLGQMTGIAFTRSRYSEGPIETSQPCWRPLMAMAAAALFFGGCCVVYVGAALRGTTGEAVRIKQDIVTIQKNTASAASSAKLDELRSKVEKLVRKPEPPILSTEGQVALFVYAVFFLSSMMYRVYANDPVFEFGLATRRYDQFRRARLEGEWAAWRQLAVLRAILHWRNKKLIEVEKQEYVGDLAADHSSLKAEIERIQKQVDSYTTARIRTFGNMLMKVRRSAAGDIDDWLNENAKAP